VRRRLLWVLLIGVALALAVMIARHDQDPIAGLSSDDWGSLAYHLALVMFVGGSVLVLFRERLSVALEATLFWVVVGFVLVFVYTYRGELRGISERVTSELMPGRVTIRSERTVEIVRGLFMGQRPLSINATAKERGDVLTDQISMGAIL